MEFKKKSKTHLVVALLNEWGVMVSKLDQQTYTSEFESHWVPLSHGLVPHLSKKLNKLPNSENDWDAGANNKTTNKKTCQQNFLEKCLLKETSSFIALNTEHFITIR